ncbi:uncharacterized protein LOC111124658 isoform X2 [Crassostrea virginica]
MDSIVQDKSEETQEKEDAPKAESNQQAVIREPQSESTDTTEPLKTGQQPEVVVDQNPQADCNKSDETPKDSSDVNVEEKNNVESGNQKDDNPKISDGNPKVPNDRNPSECSEENREKSSVPGDENPQNPMDPNSEVPNQNKNPDTPVDQPIEQTDASGNEDTSKPKDGSTDDLEGNIAREPKVPKLAETSTTPDEPNKAIPSEMKQKENPTEPEATPDKQNEGADQDLNPSGYAPTTKPAEPKSQDKEKTDEPQPSNTEPGVEDQVDMSPQVNQNRDEDVNPVNTYKEEEPKPWELSDDEHPSSPETTNPDQEEKEEEKVFVEEEDATLQETINILFIEKTGETAVQELLSNCNRYKKELKLEDVLIESAVNDYKVIQKKAGETGCTIPKNSPPSPPNELNSVTDEEKREAPSLYNVISIVAKKCPNYRRWQDAVSEFITLTTYARPEPHQSKTKRSTSVSSSGYQPKRPKKDYRDNIHRLLDQEWEEDTPPRSGIDYDYRHLLTSQSVLRSEFPDANILDEVDIKVRGPDEVPFESRHRALYHFLCKVDMTKCGVDPAQAWNDYGRLTLAERQLDLARRARGPDLDLNVILKKDKYNKLLKELKDKTEEIEELSTRLSRFASQQLTEGNPNIADLSDTHRPTRLGEMYSQLFDDEWSEAFEAFKNKADGNEDDDDIFPDTLFILQNILTQIFQFCQAQSERQKVELEDGFAVAVGLKQPKVIMVAKVEEEIERKAKNDEDEVVKDANISKPDAQEKDNSKTDTKDTGELSEQPKEDTEEKKETLKTDNREEVNNQERYATKNTTSPDGDGSGDKDERAKNDGSTVELEPGQETVNPGSGIITESGERDNKTLETNKEITETEMNTKTEKGLEKDTDKVEETTSDGNKNDNIENPEQKDEVMDLTDKNDQALKTEKGSDKTSEDDRSNEKAAREKAIQREILLEIARTTEEQNEDRSYRKNSVYSTIERHAREIRKALAATSAKTKSKLFIDDDLPFLIPEKVIREDARIMLYVQKCLELCWYMRMQDPPMVIVTPLKGEEVDKNLFSYHGRRGKTVEVCVWPALLLHENGPLVCKGYVLPEDKKRKK